MADTFESSDSVRSGKPLKHVQTATFREPLELETGGRLPEVTVAFETYGTLNAAKDNAVLICHALTGDSHVAQHDEEDDPGWWEVLVGPGKPVDTNRYFVICPNILGGCRGTTGPNSINPKTGHRYATQFPVITIGDITAVQVRLLDYLGIKQLHAALGCSLGGHILMTLATCYPDRLLGAAALATSPRLTSQAIAFDVVGRNAILRDPAYHHGDYYDHRPGPVVGLAIARMLAHITYLSGKAMTQKFDAQRLKPRDVQTQFEKKFSVGSYLAYQGDRFGERFDANSYLTLTMAVDLFDLGDTQEKLAEVLGRSKCRWLLVSFSSDWLFPTFQSHQLVHGLIAAGRPVSYCEVESDCGHDAFLLPDQIDIYGELVREFLNNLRSAGAENRLAAVPTRHEKNVASPAGEVQKQPDSPADETRIFSHRRFDYDTILDLIPRGASVLDLGCGSGELLARLRDRGHEKIMGVEWDEYAILDCVRRGINAVQADLNKGLASFADGQFDVVLLSQTLQSVRDASRVLHDMLRVGRLGIVSFPNVAFRKLRTELAEHGRAPRVHAEYGYQWHNTPYVRSLSISDFEEFCADEGIKIQRLVALDTEADALVHDDPNLNADVAVVVLSDGR